MKRTSLIHYFANGFALANRGLDILLIDLLLVIPWIVHTHVKNTLLGNTASLLAYIFTFIGTVYALSIPVFLVYKQQKTGFTYREVFSIVVENSKRMILPAIVSFLLFFALFMILLFILLTTKVIGPPSFSVSDEWQHITSIMFIFVLSFFEFTSFYFSLEYNGFFTSMKKGMTASFNNTRYIAPVILCRIASYAILILIPMGILWGDLLRSVISHYVNFVVIASSLYYYQDVIKAQDMIEEDPFVATPRGRTVNRRP